MYIFRKEERERDKQTNDIERSTKQSGPPDINYGKILDEWKT